MNSNQKLQDEELDKVTGGALASAATGDFITCKHCRNKFSLSAATKVQVKDGCNQSHTEYVCPACGTKNTYSKEENNVSAL